VITEQGSTTETLGADDVRELLARALEPMSLDGKRVLVIIPDGTRTAPIPLLFRLLYEEIGRRVARLDYLIALGTHQHMSEEAIDRLVGATAAERAERYPNVAIFNHRWDLPDALVTVGSIPRTEAARLSDGLLADEVPVVLNRMILDYDQLVICGPVFPHEVVGFSGGAKYLFPGIAGADIISFTHWLSALATSMNTMGVKDTPVRRVIHRAAEFVDTPIVCLALVMEGATLHGMYIGEHEEAWSAAADLSAQLNIVRMPHAFHSVLSMPAEIYDDLWTAAKAMYKTEPVVADGGRGHHLRAPGNGDLLHPRSADRRGRIPRARLLREPVGSLRAHSRRHPGTQHTCQGTGHVRRRRRDAAHSGDPRNRYPRGALPARQPRVRRPPDDRPRGVGRPRGGGHLASAARRRSALPCRVAIPRQGDSLSRGGRVSAALPCGVNAEQTKG
jgi:hypothetical protein